MVSGATVRVVGSRPLSPGAALREPPLVLRLHPADDVLIACREIPPGTTLADQGVVVRKPIPAGHKVAATRAVATDAPVRRYGQVIGFATQPVDPRPSNSQSVTCRTGW